MPMLSVKLVKHTFDVMAFIRGFALGSALGALGATVCQLWLWRAEEGEIEPQGGSEDVTDGIKNPEVLVVEQRKVVSGMGDKPSLAELTREKTGETRTDYNGVVDYKGDRKELLTKDDLDESSEPDAIEVYENRDTIVDEGAENEIIEEESDIIDTRIYMTSEKGAPKITKAVRDAMNARFEVITEGSYRGDAPYNDKYEAYYFVEDNVLAGFDGDLMRVADELMVAMAYDAIVTKGVRDLYLRDDELGSDFHISACPASFETAYRNATGVEYHEEDD